MLSARQTLDLIQAVRAVRLEETVLDYLTLLIERTRSHRALLLGASPRASLGLHRAAQAVALMDGRDFVLPDDVKALAVPVLAHRVMERERTRSDASADIIGEILDTTPVPL